MIFFKAIGVTVLRLNYKHITYFDNYKLQLNNNAGCSTLYIVAPKSEGRRLYVVLSVYVQ